MCCLLEVKFLSVRQRAHIKKGLVMVYCLSQRAFWINSDSQWISLAVSDCRCSDPLLGQGAEWWNPQLGVCAARLSLLCSGRRAQGNFFGRHPHPHPPPAARTPGCPRRQWRLPTWGGELLLSPLFLSTPLYISSAFVRPCWIYLGSQT